MSGVPIPERPRVKWPLLLLLPFAAGGLCCWLIFRSPVREKVLPPVDPVQSGLEAQLEGIEPSQVEALAIDRRGDAIEIGLLLTTIEVEHSDDGLSRFDAELFNLGDFPLENARVELRLKDEEKRFVDIIVLTSDQIILASNAWAHLAGSYQVGGSPPRIVEEKLYLASDPSVNFTTYSYGETRTSPGALLGIANLLPFLTYEVLWTNPEKDWAYYEAQFRLDQVLGR